MQPLRLTALALLAPALFGAAEPDVPRPLAELHRAYAGSGAFEEILELEIELPDGTPSQRRMTYGLTSDGAAYFQLTGDASPALRAVGRDGRAVVLWEHVPERYAEAPYEGDLAASLAAMEAGQLGLVAPPSLVAAQGGGLDAFREAFGFALLRGLEVTGAREVDEQVAGSATQVELAAPGGRVVLTAGGEPPRLLAFELTVGEGEGRLHATGRFTLSARPDAQAAAWPDLAGRSAVATVPALEASGYPVGDPAPDVALRTLDGGEVRIADLAGSVVVLDFWATWCVPCWAALEHTEELARWAQRSGLPVEVFAVDALESGEGFAARRDRVRGFLESRALDLPILIDADDSAFAAFHSPGLPSLVILDRHGRLAVYHSGVLDEMVETVRAEVLELLDR